MPGYFCCWLDVGRKWWSDGDVLSLISRLVVVQEITSVLGYRHISQDVGMVKGWGSGGGLALVSLMVHNCEDTGILTLHWSTYGYFRTLCTRKSTYGYFRYLHTHTTHRSHAHFTCHVNDWQAQVYVPGFRTQFTRYVQDLQAHFTCVQFTPPTYVYNLCTRITCTIYAPNLRVQSTS